MDKKNVSSANDVLLVELKEIKVLLQKQLILQGAQAGLNKAQTRELAGVASETVTKYWSHIKKSDK